MECVLQGAIHESNKDNLVQRLVGVCQSVETPFTFREMVFKSVGPSPSELRVRCDLKKKKDNWKLRSATTPSTKTKLPVTLRSVVEVKVSDNIISFLDALGFKYDFEFIQEGTESVAVVNNRTFTITISKLKKTHGPENFDESVVNMLLVELCTICTDEEVNQAAEDIHTFAEYLSPVLELTRVDNVVKRTMPAVGGPPGGQRIQIQGASASTTPFKL